MSDTDLEAVRADEAGNAVMAALQNIPAFASLEGRLLKDIAAIAHIDVFEPGETVFTMGQADDALYSVTRGEARLTQADGERGDISVETLTAGSWAGLIAFALDDSSMAAAALQAVGPLTLLGIDPNGLREIAEGEPPVAMALMRLCAETARGRKKTADPGARVYRYLLGLVRKTAGGSSIPEMPRHAALAEASGVSDVEAAGAVAELISRGIAKRAYPGLDILQPGALHRAAFD